MNGPVMGSAELAHLVEEDARRWVWHLACTVGVSCGCSEAAGLSPLLFSSMHAMACRCSSLCRAVLRCPPLCRASAQESSLDLTLLDEEANQELAAGVAQCKVRRRARLAAALSSVHSGTCSIIGVHFRRCRNVVCCGRRCCSHACMAALHCLLNLRLTSPISCCPAGVRSACQAAVGGPHSLGGAPTAAAQPKAHRGICRPAVRVRGGLVVVAGCCGWLLRLAAAAGCCGWLLRLAALPYGMQLLVGGGTSACALRWSHRLQMAQTRGCA